MALEQFSIVLGVVFGFWIGFITRSSIYPFSSGLSPFTPIYSTIFRFLAHPARRAAHSWCRPGAWMFFPPAVATTVGTPWEA
jgi:hypothetical protein